MRRLTAFILMAMTLLALSGCRGGDSTANIGASRAASREVAASAPEAKSDQSPALPAARASGSTAGAGNLQVSLNQATEVQAATDAANRKIIRNAELNIEIETPTEGLSKITSIAESLGGFVVTSEMKQSDGGQSKTAQTVIVTARVPSLQFGAALTQIRGVGSRLTQEKVTGQDVSEEYLDLEARIRTKKALEQQFLEIMKQARKVSEALEVQSQLAEVRTEIERLEGRRRFLENQSALSTIKVTLQTPAPIVTASTSSFGDSIKRTLGTSVDTAVSIVLGLIQFLIVLIPIAILIGIPGWLLWRVLRRRLQLAKEHEPQPEAQQ